MVLVEVFSYIAKSLYLYKHNQEQGKDAHVKTSARVPCCTHSGHREILPVNEQINRCGVCRHMLHYSAIKQGTRGPTSIASSPQESTEGSPAPTVNLRHREIHFCNLVLQFSSMSFVDDNEVCKIKWLDTPDRWTLKTWEVKAARGGHMYDSFM